MRKHPEKPILLIDDEPAWTKSLATRLATGGGFTNLVACQQGEQARYLLKSHDFSVVLLELRMPPPGGAELLGHIRENYPELPVIVVSGLSDHKTVVDVVRQGAFDYFVKGHDESLLIASLHKVLKIRALELEPQPLQGPLLSARLEHPEAFNSTLGHSDAMRRVFSYLEAVAAGSQPVLITGESGTGKELAARAVHRLTQARGPWVAVNVAGLDDTMFSDTLFGHVAGAFTGADKPRKGMLESAGGGTLFLDEIGDLSLASQLKLLRLVQEEEYFPLGADSPRRSSARLIVATNVNLEAAVAAGNFRKDLYYRLNAHHVHLPPLRQRKEEIPVLLQQFLETAAHEQDKRVPAVPEELYVLLNNYDFPGNVRELQGMVYEAVSLHSRGKLSLETFYSAMGIDTDHPVRVAHHPEEALLRFSERLPSLEEAGHLLVMEALRRCEGNQSMAARMLGISRQALAKRLKKTHIQRPGENSSDTDNAT